MAKAKAKTRPIAIPVTARQIAMWKCAAALAPVPPTWLGPTWARIVAAPAGPKRGTRMVRVSQRIFDRRKKDFDRLEPDEIACVLGGWLDTQALGILFCHGLQRIPGKPVPQWDMDDDIPF